MSHITNNNTRDFTLASTTLLLRLKGTERVDTDFEKLLIIVKALWQSLIRYRAVFRATGDHTTTFWWWCPYRDYIFSTWCLFYNVLQGEKFFSWANRKTWTTELFDIDLNPIFELMSLPNIWVYPTTGKRWQGGNSVFHLPVCVAYAFMAIPVCCICAAENTE